MTDDPYADRKRLTFAQAEGVEPLPSQLQLKEISQQLRASLWHLIHERIKRDMQSTGHSNFVGDTWGEILCAKHVEYDHKMADEFSDRASELIKGLKLVFEKGNYVSVFGVLQFFLRHRKCPTFLSKQIDEKLLECRAAYRVLDGKTFIPISSDAEHATLTRAFTDLSASEFQGARAHLGMAGEHLTTGKFADSVRESIHAVESVARVIAPSGKFSEALTKLEASAGIHGALKAGFGSIYGYTSDENGLRHPLLDGPRANVDEVDALFMIGACASFVSYMINKARLAGLLKS